MAARFASEFLAVPVLRSVWDDYQRDADLPNAIRRLRKLSQFQNLINRFAKDPQFQATVGGLLLDPRIAAALERAESSVLLPVRGKPASP